MTKDLDVYKAIAILEMSAMSDDKMTVERAEELRQVIEKELKDYATLYEELGVALSLNVCQNVQEWISLMKKKLKALDIIKNKEIDIKAFNDLPNLEEYNYYCSPELTQEEYDLLKEMLL